MASFNWNGTKNAWAILNCAYFTVHGTRFVFRHCIQIVYVAVLCVMLNRSFEMQPIMIFEFNERNCYSYVEVVDLIVSFCKHVAYFRWIFRETLWGETVFILIGTYGWIIENQKKNNYIQNANVGIYIRHRIVLLFLVSKLIPIFCFDWWSNSLKMNKNHLWIKVAYNKRTAFACMSYWMHKINGQNGARLIQNFCNCNKSSAMPKTILVWLSPFLAAQMLRILNKKI